MTIIKKVSAEMSNISSNSNLPRVLLPQRLVVCVVIQPVTVIRPAIESGVGHEM